MRHPRWPSVMPANVEKLGRRVCLLGANRRCQRRSVMPLPQTIHPNISSVPSRSPIYPRPSISTDSAPAGSPQGPSTKPGLNSPNIPPTHKKEHRPFPPPPPVTFSYFVSGAAACARHWTGSLPSCFSRLWVHVSGSRAGVGRGKGLDGMGLARPRIHFRLISAPRAFRTCVAFGGSPRWRSSVDRDVRRVTSSEDKN